MQHPSLTLIIKNPNNTLQLAHQPQLKNLLIIKCSSCNQTAIIKNTVTEYKCKNN
jgi:hypothetical protein